MGATIDAWAGIVYRPGFRNEQKHCLVLIFCHGNFHTVDVEFYNHMTDFSQLFGNNVLLPEYPGYGNSANSGSPTAQMLRNVVNYAMQEFEPQNIFIVGQSVGTSVAMQFAAESKLKLGGIVLVSPYTSLVQTAIPLLHIITRWFDYYNTKMNMNAIRYKLLIIHGMKDTVIPYDNSVALYEHAMTNNLRTVNFITRSQLGHNDIFDQKTLRHIKQFIH